MIPSLAVKSDDDHNHLPVADLCPRIDEDGSGLATSPRHQRYPWCVDEQGWKTTELQRAPLPWLRDADTETRSGNDGTQQQPSTNWRAESKAGLENPLR